MNHPTLKEQVEEVFKKYKSSDNKNDEDLEFVDVNKSIEKMLTARSSEKKGSLSL